MATWALSADSPGMANTEGSEDERMVCGDGNPIQGARENGGHSQSGGVGGDGGISLDAELMEPFGGVCTISAKAAVLIYLAKKEQASRRGDGLAMRCVCVCV